MKINITHACGHEITHNLKSKEQGEANKARLADKLCFKCVSAEKNKANVKKAKKEGLPELIGTEKQIAWASTIRFKLIAQAKCDFRKDHIPPSDVSFLIEKWIKDRVSAGWWIKNRELFGEYLTDMINSEYGGLS